VSGWDWTFVGELIVGLALGLAVGGWVLVGFVRGLAYELLSNPTVQRFSKVADQLAGKGDQGPWWGKLVVKGAETLGLVPKE
jgi:hypothetical protein